MKIKLSRSDWKEIGAKMGWLKTAQVSRNPEWALEPKEIRVEKLMHAEEFSDQMPEIMGVANDNYQIEISAVVQQWPTGREDVHEELSNDEPMKMEAFYAFRLDQDTDEPELLSDKEMVQFNKELQGWLNHPENKRMVESVIIGMARSM